MAGIDYQTEIQRACICYINKDGELGQPTYEGCILWGHVILMTNLWSRETIRIDLDNPGEDQAFYRKILTSDEPWNGYNTLVIFDHNAASRFEPRRMEKGDMLVLDKNLLESNDVYEKGIRKFINTGCELVGERDEFKTLKDFRISEITGELDGTYVVEEGQIIRPWPYYGDGPFAYTVRVLNKDGNNVYEVNTPINDVLNRVQQLVIDEYLEITQPKKWAFKKEGNDE